MAERERHPLERAYEQALIEEGQSRLTEREQRLDELAKRLGFDWRVTDLRNGIHRLVLRRSIEVGGPTHEQAVERGITALELEASRQVQRRAER